MNTLPRDAGSNVCVGRVDLEADLEAVAVPGRSGSEWPLFPPSSRLHLKVPVIGCTAGFQIWGPESCQQLQPDMPTRVLYPTVFPSTAPAPSPSIPDSKIAVEARLERAKLHR